nr:hypothetical protein [Tanacetum cinerariifolium]
MFDFLIDELEPRPAYDFFAPEPLLGYACNLNNNNGWIESDVPLLREVEVVADEPMVGLLVNEIAEPIVEAEEQVIALVVVMDEDIAMIGALTECLRGRRSIHCCCLGTPLPAPGLPIPPSVIEDLSTRLGNLEYEHRQLVKKVIQVSDAEVAVDILIREIGLRVFAIEGQVQALQAAVHQRDSQIQQLQTMVSKMSSRESMLMQCILGMDRRLA